MLLPERFSRFIFVIALAFASVCGAQGTYPAKPIRVIVPFAAGGATDQVARLLASRLSALTGVAVVVDNKPGANGNIGAELVAKSPADGYTLLHSTSSLAFTEAFHLKVPYQLKTDLAPVSLLTDQPLIIMASRDLGVTSFDQLKALAKTGKPLSYGSSGIGNLTHLAMHVLLQSAGINATHVPYKGGAGAFPDFIAGRIDLFADPINSAYPHVRDGRVVALAVTSAKRSPLLPDVPTASEAILKGFSMGAWQALMAPAGTPPEVIARLSALYRQILQSPEIKSKLMEQGAEAIGDDPKAFAAFLDAEITRWDAVVRESGIRIE